MADDNFVPKFDSIEESLIWIGTNFERIKTGGDELLAATFKIIKGSEYDQHFDIVAAQNMILAKFMTAHIGSGLESYTRELMALVSVSFYLGVVVGDRDAIKVDWGSSH